MTAQKEKSKQADSKFDIITDKFHKIKELFELPVNDPDDPNLLESLKSYLSPFVVEKASYLASKICGERLAQMIPRIEYNGLVEKVNANQSDFMAKF